MKKVLYFLGTLLIFFPVSVNAKSYSFIDEERKYIIDEISDICIKDMTFYDFDENEKYIFEKRDQSGKF